MMKTSHQANYEPQVLNADDLDSDGKSRVFQIGFYILSSVGLDKLLNTEIQPFPSVMLSLSSSSDFLHRSTNKLTPKKLKKVRKNKENEFVVSNRRSRRRHHATPTKGKSKSKGKGKGGKKKEDRYLKNQQLVAVNERQNKSYTFHDGVLEFLQRALRFLAEARSCSPQQLVSRILFNLAETLGETLDKPNQKDLERAVNEAVRQAQVNCSHRGHVDITQTICLDRSVSGLIVSYKEHDDIGLSHAKLTRVKRGMHFDIPLKPFEATVEYPKKVPRNLRYSDAVSRRKRYKKCNQEDLNQRVINFLEDQDARSRMVVDRTIADQPPCSPQSFPPSPIAREEVMSHFDEHTQNVLYRVRDELRGDEQDNDRARKTTFNICDTHNDIVLFKGGHSCATKHKIESFCSTRALLPVQFSRSAVTYYEFEIDAQVPRPRKKSSAKVFVGLSTPKLPLSCLTGSARHSIGMNLSGRILKEGQSFSAVFASGSYAVVSPTDTIGVCTKINGFDREQRRFDIAVAFFINGHRVYGQYSLDEHPGEGFSLLVPEKAVEMYPTVTIYSQHTCVTCRFAAQDMIHFVKGSRDRTTSKTKYWIDIAQFAEGRKVLALDGNPVY